MTFGGRTLMEQTLAEEEAGRRLDLDLARKQIGLVVQQLRGEGRDVAADIVEDLDRRAGELTRDLEEVRADLALLQKKPGRVKTSGGRDHASARGTISNGGKAVNGAAASTFSSSGHKHKYNAEGVCTALSWIGGVGKKCEAKRQRQARKPKQTTIPGVEGSKAASAEGSA